MEKNEFTKKNPEENTSFIDSESVVEEKTISADSETHVDGNTNPVDSESVVEENTNPADSESVVEESANPADSETLVEENTNPVDSESVVEENTNPVDSETVVEEGANPADSESVVEESANLADSETVVEGKTVSADSETPVDGNTNLADSETPVDGNTNPTDSETVVEGKTVSADSETHVDGNTNPVDSETVDEENPSTENQDDTIEEITLEENSATIDEELVGEPIVIGGEEKELIQTGPREPDTTDDGKLKINRKYDLSSREAIREATKIMQDEREKKVVKDLPYKKLPFIFKRAYTQGSLKRRILKKIYIPEERKEVELLFQNGDFNERTKRYSIPKDAMFSKKEIKKYKSLAREIKNQNKLRIRLIPLAAVAALIVLAVSWIIANKNRIVRDFIVATFQGVFQAKTDIDYVSVKIIDASITIGGLKVGNRRSVMKNLFEVNRIQFDFDLVQLLKKRFVCENLEASGIAWNTDRKTSCALSDNPPTGSAFSQELQRRLTNSLNALKNQAYDILGGSDVESIIANFWGNINTPEVVKQTIADVNVMYEKWKDKPAYYEAEVKKFTESVQNLQTINLASFNIRNPDDIAKLTDALEKIKKAIETGQLLAKTVQQGVIDIKNDAVAVTDMATNVKNVVKSDYDYIVERLTTITGTLANLQGLMNSALNTIAYNMLGEWYPYVMDALSMAQSMKSDKPKEEKKKESKRAKGTDFYFTPAYPSMLIKNVLISGTGFSCNVREITNDQNVRNIPTTGTLVLDIKGIRHTGKVTYDARKTSTAPMISASYTGEGFSVNIDGTGIATKCGVPSIKGNAVLSMSGSGGPNGFAASGSIDVNNVQMTSDGFENEIVTRYYLVGLNAVNRLAFGFNMGYTKDSGFYFGLTGNFAEQFTNSLKSIVMQLGKDAKALAVKKLNELLNSSENEVLVKVKEFLGLEGEIDVQNIKLADIQKTLLAKKTDIENMINGKIQTVKEEVTSVVNEKVNEAKEQATAVITEKTEEVKKTVTDAITNTIGSGLGGLLGGKKSEDEDGESEKDNKSSNPLGGLLKGFGF